MGDKVWFVISDGKEHGPYLTSELVNKVALAEISMHAFVIREGMNDWASLRSVKELMVLLEPNASNENHITGGEVDLIKGMSDVLRASIKSIVELERKNAGLRAALGGLMQAHRTVFSRSVSVGIIAGDGKFVSAWKIAETALAEFGDKNE